MRIWRWAGWIAGTTAVVGLFLWVALGPGDLWILENFDEVKGLSGKDLAEALDRVRGRVIAVATVLVGAVAIVFTALGARAALENSAATQQTADSTKQVMVTGRYTAAIEQLGNKESVDVRMGGIYALGRLAEDSERDARTITEVLTAFLREHARDAGDDPAYLLDENGFPRLRADLRAALIVLGDRKHPIGQQPDLSGFNLKGLDLTGIRLRYLNLSKAWITDATLAGVDLTGTDLTDAFLERVNLEGADLTGAILREASLNEAKLIDVCLADVKAKEANLENATLHRVNAAGADLREVSLSGAELEDVDLHGARLFGAYLYGIALIDVDLRGADVTAVQGMSEEELRASAITDETTKWNSIWADLPPTSQA